MSKAPLKFRKLTPSFLPSIFLVILVAGWLIVGETKTGAESPQHLWFYAPINFQVDEDVDRLLQLMKRANKGGYNGAVLTDYKFGNFSDRPKHYITNLKRTAELAKELDLELIPCVMPVGYSNSILQNDPNLAAGLPVCGAEFEVHESEASLRSTNLLIGGNFDFAADSRQQPRAVPEGWDWIDGWGVSSGLDASEKHSGNASLRMTDFPRGQDTGNCRVVKKVSVVPHRQYQISLWAKSENLQAEMIQVSPLSHGSPLSFASLGIRTTQPWTRHAIVFNSMDATEVGIYLGVWSGKSGTLWIDDVRLSEVGGVNLIRRGGCPIQVRDAGTGKKYVEGKDFDFWQDPKLGRVPYAGEYSDDHDAPTIKLTPDSGIKKGARLKVSFYHTVIVHDGQVCCSLAADQLFDLLEDQIRAIEHAWRPNTYFFQHDEIRVAGHDELAKGRSSGELLAANFRRCEQVLRRVNSDAEIVAWSDMFDPHHNAVDHYYQTQGTMKGSWDGLSSSVVIANWNPNSPRESLQWFASRSHSQMIAGYYDQSASQNVNRWKTSMQGISNVQGWIYTTWTRNYEDLETFAKLVAQQ